MHHLHSSFFPLSYWFLPDVHNVTSFSSMLMLIYSTNPRESVGYPRKEKIVCLAYNCPNSDIFIQQEPLGKAQNFRSKFTICLGLDRSKLYSRNRHITRPNKVGTTRKILQEHFQYYCQMERLYKLSFGGGGSEESTAPRRFRSSKRDLMVMVTYILNTTNKCLINLIVA